MKEPTESCERKSVDIGKARDRVDDLMRRLKTETANLCREYWNQVVEAIQGIPDRTRVDISAEFGRNPVVQASGVLDQGLTIECTTLISELFELLASEQSFEEVL